MSFQYTLQLSGQPVHCRFEFARNVQLCSKFIVSRYEGADALRVTAAERQIYHAAYPDKPWSREAESKLFIMLVSDALLPHQRLIFHSVAILWHEKAWLITAPSGTGKTTQYRNLKRLYGEEVQVICGDNPVLHFQEDGVIMVYPSPWNGKEKFGGNAAAPLAGIVWLEQGPENKIERLAPKDAVIPVFHEMNTFSRTPELVDQLFRLEEKMITSVPVWKFENTGTTESSELLMKCLMDCDEMEQYHELQD